MGYSPKQLAALQQTINQTPADLVVAATPIDLAALIEVNKPIVRARYEFAEASEPGLAAQVEAFLLRLDKGA
jgi:predicted GTPase